MTVLTIFATEIRQLNGLYSLNDLHKAAGSESEHHPNHFLSNEQTKALIDEIQIIGIPAISVKPEHETYACHELVIPYAAWISATFYLEVIRVFLDHQTQLSGNSGQFITGGQTNEIHISAEDCQYIPAIPDKAVKVPSSPNLAIKPPKWTKPDPSGMENAMRDLHSARLIIRELQIWANTLPSDIGHPLWDALENLNKLMITSYTEITEALNHFSIGVHFLNRWLGRRRNRRIGNARQVLKQP